jgi:hypothetical protein
MAKRCRSCCTVSTAFHIQFTVTSTCQGARSGVLVTTVKAGVTRTCTTDGTGVCTIDVPTIGSFTWTAALAGYATQSGSGNVSAVGTLPISVSMGTPTGFSCLCAGISSGIPGPCLNVPIPTTLHANDGIGSFDIVVGGVSGSNLWEACITRTGTGRDAATCSISQSLSPVLYANFTCGGNPSQFALSIGGLTCFGPGNVGEFLKPNAACTAGGTFAGANSTTSLTCSPFSWSGTGTLLPAHPMYSVYGGSFSWSVSA